MWDNVNIDTIEYKLKKYKNIILYGPPGTGKTQLLKEIISKFEKRSKYNYYNTSAPIALVPAKGFSYEWCTFHPNYTYEKFISGLIPIIKDGNLGYKKTVGPLLNLIKKNSIDNMETLLIIDEINRANTEEVFGDTLALLDIYNRNNNYIELLDSIEVDGINIEKLNIDNSFYIIGTMNSLDKSTNPLNLEIKRRFSIIEIAPDSNILKKFLKNNNSISSELVDFIIEIFDYFNKCLREFVGKEFEFGQGYFWELTKEKENVIEMLSDILKYRVFPHIKEVFPNEFYIDLFKVNNLNKLFYEVENEYELMNISEYNSSDFINLIALACDSNFRISYDHKRIYKFKDFKEYENFLVNNIYTKVKKYKNIILSGVSGVGKTSKIRLLKEYFGYYEEMIWHANTSYEEVLAGISSELDEKGHIRYNIKSGKFKKLIDTNFSGDKLMIIENLDKSDSAENFGELITLIEQDKRDELSIKIYDDVLKVPSNVNLICTMNSINLSQNKLDSALKRRFVIIELFPDYLLLELWFNIKKININKENLEDLSTKEEYLNLAIRLLKGINEKIIKYIGVDYQIGHSVFWGLKFEKSLNINNIYNIFDDFILTILEDYVIDEDLSEKIFGENSYLIKKRKHGIEIQRFKDLEEDKRYEVLKWFYV